MKFALGDTLTGYSEAALADAAPWDAVTHWYNGPADLHWQLGYRWHRYAIDEHYDAGRSIQLVVWLAASADTITYAQSPQFLDHIAQLIDVFRPHPDQTGALYINLFSEINATYGGPDVEAKLVDQFVLAKAAHYGNPQLQFGLGFGGYSWLNNYTINLAPYQRALAVSDWVGAQAMFASNSDQAANAFAICDMVRQLGTYGLPVHIEHSTVWAQDGVDPNAAHVELIDRVLASGVDVDWWAFKDEPHLRDPDGAVFQRIVQLVTRGR